MWFSKKRRRLNLALQGGGAHGAFTWGVLDQLLLDDEIEISGISGTSAGAFNAIAIAHGLATGDGAADGRQAARDTLKALWSEVESAHVPDLLRLNPLLSSFARSASPIGVFSPYSFNPLGFDPLRKILEKHIDFEAVRANTSVQLMIAATDIATGKARIFSGQDVTVNAILASACLPTIHHAVEIDGRAYWDGGFSANPDILSLASESPVSDTLLILLNPVRAPGIPRSAVDIEARVSTITFNQPLIRDVDTIVRAKELSVGWFAPRRTRLRRLKAHRFHLIEAGRHTALLRPDTKAMPDREILRQLYHGGLIEAERWMRDNKKMVGKKSTVSLRQHFMTPDATDGDLPAAEPEAIGDDAALAKTA